MGLLAYPFLALLHLVHLLAVLVISIIRRFKKSEPLPLKASRQRIPKHLAILFVSDSEIDARTTEQRLLESVVKSIRWCRQVGIGQLSLYDRDGILLTNIQKLKELREGVEQDLNEDRLSRSTVHYPPTPPMSDYSESRSLSPEGEWNSQPSFTTIHLPGHENSIIDVLSTTRASRSQRAARQDQPLTIFITSRASSKPSVASAARSMAYAERRKAKISHTASKLHNEARLSLDMVESYIEGKNGLPAPDLMIIHPIHPSKYHRSPMELHGYPPWQIRLTEIYCNRYRKQYRARLMWFFPSQIKSTLLSTSLTELEFRDALDQFAGAQMRFGK